MKFVSPFGKKKTKGTSSPEIHIVICKLMNDRTPIEILEFEALQLKDANFNMNIVNEDQKFKEELEKKKHYILEHLHYKLELSSMSRSEKIAKIVEKIAYLEKDLTELKDGKLPKKDENGKVVINEKTKEIEYQNINRIDLETDLRHFRVLRYTIENDGDGSYEIINKNGQRELRFLLRDGIFHPYFYRSDSDNGMVLTMHPNIGLSRKYWKEIDEKIEMRFLAQQNENNFFAGIKGFLITIAILGVLLSGVIWNVRNFENAQEIDAKLDECRAKCVTGATDCAFFYGQLIKDELVNRSVNTSIGEAQTKQPTKTLVDISGEILGTG